MSGPIFQRIMSSDDLGPVARQFMPKHDLTKVWELCAQWDDRVNRGTATGPSAIDRSRS